MRTTLRHATPALAALLAAAALAPGLLQPAVASASAATRAEHAALRAERAAERASRREARERERRGRRETRERERAVKGTEAAGAATPTNATGSVGGSTNCQLTLQASSSLITAGETASVFGDVACPENASASGLQLTVFESERGLAASAAGATALGSAHVASDGTYRLEPVALQHTTIFHVRLGSSQARAVVRVAPVVTLKGPDPTAKASTIAGTHAASSPRVTFTGTVTPAEPGTIVSLRIAYGDSGQWQTAALGRVGEDGAYSLTHSFKTPGLVHVRAIAHVHGHSNVNGASETLAYQVSIGDVTTHSAGTLVAVQPALTLAAPPAATTPGTSPTPTGTPTPPSG